MSIWHILLYLTILAIFALPFVLLVLLLKWVLGRNKPKPEKE